MAMDNVVVCLIVFFVAGFIAGWNGCVRYQWWLLNQYDNQWTGKQKVKNEEVL